MKAPEIDRNIQNDKNIPLQKKWIKLTLPNKKSLFYNKNDDTVTIYPPFPKTKLNEFLNFYQLGIDEIEFNFLLNQAITNNPGQNQKEPIDLSPITDKGLLNQLESLSKFENVEKILLKVFNIKFNVNPNYEYSSKDPEREQYCVLKIKGRNFVTGKEGKNKIEAKDNADRLGLQMLLPKENYDKIIININNYLNQQSSEEEKEEGQLPDIQKDNNITNNSKTIQSVNDNKKEKFIENNKKNFNNHNTLHNNATTKKINNNVPINKIEEVDKKASRKALLQSLFTSTSSSSISSAGSTTLKNSTPKEKKIPIHQYPVSHGNSSIPIKEDNKILQIHQKDFLNHKRRPENEISQLKQIKSATQIPNQNQYINQNSQLCYEEEIVTCCFDDDQNLEDLEIDNPRIVNEYKDSFTYKPLEMITILKKSYPKLDINITTSNNNASIKIKNMPNRTTVRAEIYSKILGIYAEANEDNKQVSLQYCAQRFLKKVYRGKFTTWVKLNEFFKKNKGMYLEHLNFDLK